MPKVTSAAYIAAYSHSRAGAHLSRASNRRVLILYIEYSLGQEFVEGDLVIRRALSHQVLVKFMTMRDVKIVRLCLTSTTLFVSFMPTAVVQKYMRERKENTRSSADEKS